MHGSHWIQMDSSSTLSKESGYEPPLYITKLFHLYQDVFFMNLLYKQNTTPETCFCPPLKWLECIMHQSSFYHRASRGLRRPLNPRLRGRWALRTHIIPSERSTRGGGYLPLPVTMQPTDLVYCTSVYPAKARGSESSLLLNILTTVTAAVAASSSSSSFSSGPSPEGRGSLSSSLALSYFKL